jgi:DegV family protein with EDD domain
MNYIEPHFKNGHDILYVHFSKNMSGTFQSLALALEELKEKYPERKFYAVDTKAITCLGYAIAKEGIRMWKEGYSAEEIVAHIEEFRNHYAIYFYSDDLKFFAKSGRVSNFAALMGGLIGLHPIISICDDGVMRSVSKVRGKKKALKSLVEYMKAIGDEVEKYPIYLAHSDADEILDELEVILKEELGDNIILQRVMVNPTAGSHCGPNNVGLCFHSKSR